VIALFTAALAGIGNIVLAYVNGKFQREAEQRKSEGALVLEMIKTSSPDKAAENLAFLADSGLLTQEEQVQRIRIFLKQRKPGQGPALPAPGNDRIAIESSDNLPATTLKSLADEILRYSRYLEGMGFPDLNHRVRLVPFSKEGPLPVEAGNDDAQAIKDGWLSFYKHGLLFVRMDVIDHPYFPLREYTHYALEQALGGVTRVNEVESGLADYLSLSFLELPDLAQATSYSYLPSLESDSSRLKRDMPYREDDPSYVQDAGHVWAAAFWHCQKDIGRPLMANILLRAWTNTFQERGDRELLDKFHVAVVNSAEAISKNGACFAIEFKGRGL